MGFVRRLANTISGSTARSDIDEELRSHINQLADDYLRAGMTAEEARQEALRKFGNRTLVAERTRDAGGVRWAEDFVRDVRGGARGLPKHRGFAAVALVTLAIGIGANTAMFSMLHGVLIRPLAYRDPDRLVAIARGNVGETQNRFVARQRFEALQKQASSLTDVGAYLAGMEDVMFSGSGEPEVLKAARVSANFLDILGVRPESGRSFRPEDDTAGGPPVAMISARLWRRRFGADPTLSSATATINSLPYTIVGVLPDSFRFPFPAVDLWFPRPSEMASLAPQYRTCCAPLRVFARMKPGVSLEQVRAELSVLSARYAAASPLGLDKGVLLATPLKDEITAPVNTMLWVLVAAVAFVLLIACANVAMLLIARAAARGHEFAVRAALGAARAQLVRQLLAESLVLAVGGGILGVLLAQGILSIVRQMTIFDLPRANEIGLDGVVLLFAVTLSLVAGVVFGTFPSLHMLRPDLMQPLRLNGTNDAPSMGRTQIVGFSARTMLVVGQMTLCTVLLIGAGLMIKTIAHLANIDPGFQADGLLTMKIPLPTTKYDSPVKRSLFFEQLVERVHAIPGVRGAAVMRALPTTPGVLNTNLQINEQPIPEPGHTAIRIQTISPAYFSVLGVRLTRGRDLTDFDNRAGAARVVIINESFARRFWPAYPAGSDPIGKRITVPILGSGALEIVGIVRDVRELGLTRNAIPQFYIPNALYPPQTAYLAIRAASDRSSIVGAVKAAVQEIDADQSVGDIRTMANLLEVSEAPRHLTTRLLTLFAGTALLLALVGIYGVVAYSVTQRTSEIGLRRALGAGPIDILQVVLAQLLRQSVIGVVFGVTAAIALTRVMQTLLFEVSTTDQRVYIGVATAFIIIALLAGSVPAWRAVRISPMVALRS